MESTLPLQIQPFSERKLADDSESDPGPQATNSVLNVEQEVVSLIIQGHQAEDDNEWREVIYRRGRARGIREGISHPSIVEQNRPLLTALTDSSSHERYHQMSVRHGLQAREYKKKNRELEIELARLRVKYEQETAAQRNKNSQLMSRLSHYYQFIEAHGLSKALELHEHLHRQRQAAEDHLKLYEDFVNSQHLSEAFNRAHPE